MQENAEQQTETTNSLTKIKKSLKHDFSFVNWGEATKQWFKGVKKQYTTLFLEVSKQACILAGIKVKLTDILSSSLGSDSDSSGCNLDSNYEGLGDGRNDFQNNSNDNIDKQTGKDGGNQQDGSSDEDGGQPWEGDDKDGGQPWEGDDEGGGQPCDGDDEGGGQQVEDISDNAYCGNSNSRHQG